MVVHLLGLLGGLVLLTVAAEHFVLGAARTAAARRLSPVVIGAVVIGVGTSAPELVVSGLAAGRGQLDIAVGNVVGSNLANLSLVLGVAALAATITVGSTTLRREAPLSLGSVVAFAVAVQGGLGRAEGVVLLVALVGVLAWLVPSARREGNEELSSEVDEYLADGGVDPWREGGRALAGLVGTVLAAQLLVVSASAIAAELGLAEGFVGLTVVAVGTSLPELATSLQAARRDEPDLIVGNLLGSNLFNSLAVAGVVGLVGPGAIEASSLVTVAVPAMVGVALVATAFMVSGRRVTAGEGTVLLAAYAATLPLAA